MIGMTRRSSMKLEQVVPGIVIEGRQGQVGGGTCAHEWKWPGNRRRFIFLLSNCVSLAWLRQ